MIEAYHVSKTYARGVYALRDLSLRVEKGDFVFLTGPSGAGKSTLLRLLLRQDVPTEGQLTLLTDLVEQWGALGADKAMLDLLRTVTKQ